MREKRRLKTEEIAAARGSRSPRSRAKDVLDQDGTITDVVLDATKVMDAFERLTTGASLDEPTEVPDVMSAEPPPDPVPVSNTDVAAAFVSRMMSKLYP